VTNVRLLPVVVLAIAALLVLKTVGLVTNGGYVLTGVSTAEAAGAPASEGASHGGTTESDQTITPASEPTLQDINPTLTDAAPTIGGEPAGAEAVGATDVTAPAPPEQGPANPLADSVATMPGVYCVEPHAVITETGEAVLVGKEDEADAHGSQSGAIDPEELPAGSFAPPAIDCLPSGDAIPMALGADGVAVPLIGTDTVTDTEQQVLERLVARRSELEKYEQDLALRASIVDAAEKRIEERAATLQALESQISALVDQRQQLEASQFTGIVAMYESMRPKDAAKIFDDLDINVLLRVAKIMSPRKMAPILAQMSPPRAQELTVRMADLSDRPPTEMSPADLAALPQIVGQ
jgi:flagellar motility protein MotE (MotC chaperone)